MFLQFSPIKDFVKIQKDEARRLKKVLLKNFYGYNLRLRSAGLDYVI